MPNLLMLASGVGLVAASAALWVQGQRRADHRFFAGLISIGPAPRCGRVGADDPPGVSGSGCAASSWLSLEAVGYNEPYRALRSRASSSNPGARLLSIGINRRG